MSPARTSSKSAKKAKTSVKAKAAGSKAKSAPKAAKGAKRAAPKAAKSAKGAKSTKGKGASKPAAADNGRRHCVATDPFGDPCQSAPRLPSKYCTIHSYLDR